ncbi:hypothetical protein TNCT_142101 [Trichonephila clavata]|uniref:Uncharacterized protein n=1 Tax=Trichonephila clavata TaxID=2740835 RepID=A0A8X6FJQ3_TRICU|nr:hypothetical protein TNCT_142101 [Trichonephila clavata]
MSKLAKQDPIELDIGPEKTISTDDSKIIDDKGIIDLNDKDNSSKRFSTDNLHHTDNLLERCFSNKTCSLLTLTGDVSDAKETGDSFIQAGEGFFNETPHNDDEKIFEINNADLRSQDLELFTNENPFLDDSAFTNSVAINLIDAAVQCTPTERNGSLASITNSSYFTNVTEMESFSEDPKDFDDFSLNSFRSDRDTDSISSRLTFLRDSEGDNQSNVGPSVPKKCNAFQKPEEKAFANQRHQTTDKKDYRKSVVSEKSYLNEDYISYMNKGNIRLARINRRFGGFLRCWATVIWYLKPHMIT